MQQATLLDSALQIIFCDNDVENGRSRELCPSLFASGDLEIAFAVVEAHPLIDLDISFDRAVDNLARRNFSATYEVVEVAKAVNQLRQSKGVEYLIPDKVLGHLNRMIQTSSGYKRKCDELLDHTEREAAAESGDKTGRRKGRTRRTSQATGWAQIARESAGHEDSRAGNGAKLTTKETDGGEESTAVFRVSNLSR